MAVTNSYPAFHTTGAVHTYIRVNGFNTFTGNTDNNTPTGELWYLGTCETQPILNFQRFTRPVFNDIGGRSVPVQETYDGEIADVGFMLSRFSEVAYAKLLSMNTAFEPAAGLETNLSRGALMFGPRTFELWMYNSFFNTPIATPGMTPGYYFPQVKLMKHGPEKSGTEGKVLLIQGQAVPRYYKPSGSAKSRWALYSTSLSDFPTETQSER